MHDTLAQPKPSPFFIFLVLNTRIAFLIIKFQTKWLTFDFMLTWRMKLDYCDYDWNWNWH